MAKEAPAHTTPRVLTPEEVATEFFPKQVVVAIKIEPDGKFQVIPETFAVSKSHRQEVIWVASDPNYNFTVKFGDPALPKEKRSPFAEAEFSNAHPHSRIVREDVYPYSYYKYTVAVEHKTEKNREKHAVSVDPGGYVDP